MIDLLDDDFTVYEQIEKAAKIHDISISELFRRAKVDRQRGHHWSVNEPKSIGTLKKINNVLRELARENDVFEQVKAQRAVNYQKWGEQNHPCLDLEILNDPYSFGPLKMSEKYEVPSEGLAKSMCAKAVQDGELTYAHIFVQEIAMVISEFHPEKRRKGIVKAAAVALDWAEKIDRDLKK